MVETNYLGGRFMGSWLATTSMGNSPVVNVEVWNDGTSRNGTVVTAHVAPVFESNSRAKLVGLRRKCELGLV